MRPPATLPATGFNEVASCRSGIMLFPRHDMYVGASLRKYGEFSPGERVLFETIIRPRMVVLEIGANIGAHTVELARLVGTGGKVFAYEPQPLIFQVLCANLALNSCDNVRAFQTAIGAHEGSIKVPLLAPDRPNNYGGLSLSAQSVGEDVPMRRIDDLGLPHCHVIKLDLEGMEVEALLGAAATIRRDRPILYVEDDREARSAELRALLHDYGYRAYLHEPPLFEPHNFAGDPENLWPGVVSRNLLCLPAERGIVVNGLAEVDLK